MINCLSRYHLPVQVNHLADAQAELGLELGHEVELGDGVGPDVDGRGRVAGAGVGDVLVSRHLKGLQMENDN